MAEYSDTTGEVFRRAVAELERDLPEALHARLFTLLGEGRFHESTAVEAAIRDAINASSGRRA